MWTNAYIPHENTADENPANWMELWSKLLSFIWKTLLASTHFSPSSTAEMLICDFIIVRLLCRAILMANPPKFSINFGTSSTQLCAQRSVIHFDKNQRYHYEGFFPLNFNIFSPQSVEMSSHSMKTNMMLNAFDHEWEEDDPKAQRRPTVDFCQWG